MLVVQEVGGEALPAYPHFTAEDWKRLHAARRKARLLLTKRERAEMEAATTDTQEATPNADEDDAQGSAG